MPEIAINFLESCCSVTKSCLIRTVAHQAFLSFTISQSLLRLMFIVLMLPSNRLILHCPLLLLPSIFPSIRVFSNESTLRVIRSKYWSFSFSISPNEYSGLISFRTDWLDLFAVQGALESSPAPQFKSINSSALRLLYGPTLTSVCDYWKNHNFDYTDLTQELNLRLFVSPALSGRFFTISATGEAPGRDLARVF